MRAYTACAFKNMPGLHNTTFFWYIKVRTDCRQGGEVVNHLLLKNRSA